MKDVFGQLPGCPPTQWLRCGWIVTDSEVAIKWLDVSPAPTAVMECVRIVDAISC